LQTRLPLTFQDGDDVMCKRRSAITLSTCDIHPRSNQLVAGESQLSVVTNCSVITRLSWRHGH
jgi:hypothetical protein